MFAAFKPWSARQALGTLPIKRPRAARTLLTEISFGGVAIERAAG